MSIHGIHDWVARHPMVRDAVWAVVVFALMLTPLGIESAIERVSNPKSWYYWPLYVTWALLYAVPLLWRRIRPDIAAGGVALACVIQLFIASNVVVGDVAVPMVIYAVIAYGDRRRAKWWLILGLAGSVTAGLTWVSHDFRDPDLADYLQAGGFQAIGCAAVVLAAWFAGRFTRERRLNIEQLRQRAEDLERERDQRIRLATQEERTRIAREMHDIVAHSLSVIVVQADGGAYLAHHDDAGDIETRLETSGQALDTIAGTARHALTETRRLVGVLRDDSDHPAELAPSRGLADLPDLVSETRQALPVSLTVVGDPDSHPPLPEGAELAAYRVVQESLTNVLKHAGPAASAEVTVTHSPDSVQVLVDDNGQGTVGSVDDGAGHGLVGMRERVSAWGGTLETRDRANGGFRVHATIPIQH